MKSEWSVPREDLQLPSPDCRRVALLGDARYCPSPIYGMLSYLSVVNPNTTSARIDTIQPTRHTFRHNRCLYLRRRAGQFARQRASRPPAIPEGTPPLRRPMSEAGSRRTADRKSTDVAWSWDVQGHGRYCVDKIGPEGRGCGFSGVARGFDREEMRAARICCMEGVVASGLDGYVG